MSKSVVFCYSQRFRREGGLFIAQLRQLAETNGKFIQILDPQFAEKPDEFLKATEAERLKDEIYRAQVGGLVYEHLFKKVLPADVTMILNFNGYLGANTLGELFASAALKKICYSVDERTLMGKYPDALYEEPCASKLIHEAVGTPEALFKRLV